MTWTISRLNCGRRARQARDGVADAWDPDAELVAEEAAAVVAGAAPPPEARAPPTTFYFAPMAFRQVNRIESNSIQSNRIELI